MFGRNKKIKYFNPSREWGRESVGKTHKKYYKRDHTLHFFDVVSSAFTHFWKI